MTDDDLTRLRSYEGTVAEQGGKLDAQALDLKQTKALAMTAVALAGLALVAAIAAITGLAG